MPYKVEIIEKKIQLEASKLHIKNLFSNLLNETKGFIKYQYQTTVEVLLTKYNLNGEIEFAPVYFNSVTKTVINHRFKIENSLQEILYMTDVWLNNGASWIVESMSLNILIFQLIDHSQEILMWTYLLN